MADGSAPTEADVQLVGDALDAYYSSMGMPASYRPYGAAKVVLDALAEAGRLLPPGWTTAGVDEQFRKLRGDLERVTKPTSGNDAGLSGSITVYGTRPPWEGSDG